MDIVPVVILPFILVHRIPVLTVNDPARLGADGDSFELGTRLNHIEVIVPGTVLEGFGNEDVGTRRARLIKPHGIGLPLLELHLVVTDLQGIRPLLMQGDLRRSNLIFTADLLRRRCDDDGLLDRRTGPAGSNDPDEQHRCTKHLANAHHNTSSNLIRL